MEMPAGIERSVSLMNTNGSSTGGIGATRHRMENAQALIQILPLRDRGKKPGSKDSELWTYWGNDNLVVQSGISHYGEFEGVMFDL